MIRRRLWGAALRRFLPDSHRWVGPTAFRREASQPDSGADRPGTADQYRQFMAGDSDEVLARIERLLARMVRQNAPHGDAELEAKLKEATWRLRRRKRA
jgi:hypothetical protein